MKKIRLTKGYVTLVDDADFDWLSKWNWCARDMGRHVYAVRRRRVSDPQEWPQTVYMHRVILDYFGELLCDHSNRNTLDNRRSNLRLCTPSQNTANSRTRKSKWARGIKKRKNRWRARIEFQGKVIRLGSYETQEAASQAYRDAHKRLFGEFTYVKEAKAP